MFLLLKHKDICYRLVEIRYVWTCQGGHIWLTVTPTVLKLFNSV